MQEIVGHKIHHNVMMHGIHPEPVSLNELNDQIIMLEEISSTQNIGSIARSAAIGMHSYLPIHGSHPTLDGHLGSRWDISVCLKHTSMMIYIRPSERLKIMATVSMLQKLRMTPPPLASVKVANKWVLIMGHEGSGLSNEILDLCDEVVTI
ncbi:tRNA/rRNA methyltransferase SpoU [Sulfurovum sp. AR]|uniref:tRNA/rRNA methyltransferase SpoU n=1 Tax=Sulfurovum sp. AR TaxID=1165841 RepID=UPI00025C4F12|nr:tRNA/rRNA methyltransferase SpoU [Sulfurovum sp. AR]EIF51153.1 tRNA/rRNA methyltransferase SpoU [Sulfurovum sp. AR]